jgi:guanylate cyclase
VTDHPKTFWNRIAGRTRPAGVFGVLDDPMTIVLVVTATLWGAAVISLVGASTFFRFDEPAAGWALLAIATCDLLAWVVYAASGSIRAATSLAVLVATASNTFIHLSLGGYAHSGAIVTWGITSAIAVTVVFSRRTAVVFGLAVASEMGVFAFAEASLRAGRLPPDGELSAQLFAFSVAGNLLIMVPLISSLMRRLSVERRRAEQLLLNVLPVEVASELKTRGRTTARRFDSVSVLFADIVGFTRLSESIPAEELIEELNVVFTRFDKLVARHGCEKIRTIGDNYMVGAGFPTALSDHAQALAEVALGMLESADQSRFQFRIGINSGPVIAGVIGTSKFQYDVWGDTVNTASRMESHGQPGRIQITEATYLLIRDEYACDPRGPLEVKSKGALNVWWLAGRASPRARGRV